MAKSPMKGSLAKARTTVIKSKLYNRVGGSGGKPLPNKKVTRPYK